MQHDIEEERGFLHPEKGLKKDEMAGTADRKEFRQPLDHPKENSLWNIDFILLLKWQMPKFK
jgi:hypothetical protein